MRHELQYRRVIQILMNGRTMERTMPETTEPTDELLPAVKRLSRDLAIAAATLSDDEARYLVDGFYMMQRDRIRAAHQLRALGENREPNIVLDWFSVQAGTLEGQIKRALDRYTQDHPMGQWLRSVKGIGPVLSAGLLAHLDIEKAPTAGHFWNFAGLNPGVE